MPHRPRKSSRHFKRTVVVAACLLFANGGSVGANGWEHGAIPFTALIAALEDPSASLRARAAESLGIRGDEEAARYLANLLDLPEPDPNVRSAAYLALGKLGWQGAAPLLGRCMREETRDELRADCLAAMGAMASPFVILNVVDATGVEESILVRSAAVDALGGYSDSRAVDRLIDIAMDADNASLANRAIAALGQTGSEDAIAPLLSLLDLTNGAARQRLIARALGALRARAAVAELERLARNSEDHMVRTDATFAIGAIQDGAALPTLIAALQDPHPAVVFAALRAMMELRDASAAPDIANLSSAIHRRISEKSAEQLQADFVTVYADLSVQVEALRALAELDAAVADTETENILNRHIRDRQSDRGFDEPGGQGHNVIPGERQRDAVGHCEGSDHLHHAPQPERQNKQGGEKQQMIESDQDVFGAEHDDAPQRQARGSGVVVNRKAHDGDRAIEEEILLPVAGDERSNAAVGGVNIEQQEIANAQLLRH